MTPEEIVRGLALRIGEPYHVDGDNWGECYFCGQSELKSHADDCLWVAIEQFANRCDQTNSRDFQTYRCDRRKGHGGLHSYRGISRGVEFIFTWTDDLTMTFYSNDPVVLRDTPINDLNSDSPST